MVNFGRGRWPCRYGGAVAIEGMPTTGTASGDTHIDDDVDDDNGLANTGMQRGGQQTNV